MERKQIVERTFSELDKHLRTVSRAEIGGFRPSDKQVTSYFGGKFVGRPGEGWPEHNGEPMLPILRVRADELEGASLPDGVALLNVFMGSDELPLDLPGPSGKGWLIRTYSCLEHISKIANA